MHTINIDSSLFWITNLFLWTDGKKIWGFKEIIQSGAVFVLRKWFSEKTIVPLSKTSTRYQGNENAKSSLALNIINILICAKANYI